jgi:hypothetical protein
VAPLRRRALLAGTAAALVAVGVPGAGALAAPGGSAGRARAPAAAAPRTLTAAQLGTLTSRVDELTLRAARAVRELQLATARDVHLRVTYSTLLLTQARLQQRLDAEVRRIYESQGPDPMAALITGLAPADVQAAALGEQRQAGADAGLLRRMSALAARAARLRGRLAARRQQLIGPVATAERALERASELLSVDRIRFRAQQAAAAAAAAAERTRLAALSAQLTTAVSLPQSPAQAAAATDQGPLIAALQAAGSNIPAGYRATGVVRHGVASWYGPGFVGRPTSSGAVFNPNLPTCAMLTTPLGTVIHVTANGRGTNCLVNDRGPYGGGRILDMSPAGAAALGYSWAGVARVTITVLAAAR